VTLLEDGREIARRDVVDASPLRQVTELAVEGADAGRHVHTAVLTNQHGSTSTRRLTVVVHDR
jgi:hypothetical protein